MSSQHGKLRSPLAAEICWLVWGTPANFNGFRVLAALLHGTLVVAVSQTAALNRGRYLYSAARPSRWALAHMCSYTTTLLHFPFGYRLIRCYTQVRQLGQITPNTTFGDNWLFHRILLQTVHLMPGNGLRRSWYQLAGKVILGGRFLHFSPEINYLSAFHDTLESISLLGELKIACGVITPPNPTHTTIGLLQNESHTIQQVY